MERRNPFGQAKPRQHRCGIDMSFPPAGHAAPKPRLESFGARGFMTTDDATGPDDEDDNTWLDEAHNWILMLLATSAASGTSTKPHTGSGFTAAMPPPAADDWESWE
ncbi:hypothetical protein J3R82DRAFT_2915 [Butyriboletus roseoflavus]|nr:hypothetical protein J3R82DRAFT_2915 [Butyriboletus roseoflavus]